MMDNLFMWSAPLINTPNPPVLWRVDTDVAGLDYLQTTTELYPRHYHPLIHTPGAFRDLADTELTPLGVAKFFAEYGFLWHQIRQGAVVSELLQGWYVRIIWLHHMVWIWEAVRPDQPDDSQVEKLFKRQGSKWVILEPDLGNPDIGDDEPDNLVERFASRKVWQPPSEFPPLNDPPQTRRLNAMSYLAIRINEELHQKQFLRVQLRSAKPSDGLALSSRPDSLWDALVYQFALSIHQNERYRRCAGCMRWLKVTRSMGASEFKTTCTPACKQRFFRRRKEALEMRATGWGIEAIAKEMERPVEMVRGWLDQEEE